MNFVTKAVYTVLGGAAFGAGVVFAATQFGGPAKTPLTDILHREDIGAYIDRDQSREVHDFLAPKYDKLIATDEVVAGVDKFRVKLGERAQGSVLEVAVGSGRNFSSYGDSVTSITATDYSKEMLKQASIKASKVPVKFVQSDAHDLSATFSDERFDTVVDTFGLCSFEDPVYVLQEMQKVCKPDGQILLLEHGVSNSRWMRKFMDKKATKHAHSWACIFNRDIEGIIEKSGLVVQSIERRHFGTTYFIVAKPSPVFHGEEPSKKKKKWHSL